VTHLLGKPLLRVFPELRSIHQLEPGWGLNIVPPPDVDGTEVLIILDCATIAFGESEGMAPETCSELAGVQWYVYDLWCDGAQHCSGLCAKHRP